MVQAKLVNGCHIFLLSPSNSLSSLMKGGDKIAYAAYADWPTEISDNAITSGTQQSVCSIVEVRNSGWQQETISSTYFSFNQSINALSLAMSDPHKRDLPVGGKINQDDKINQPHFSSSLITTQQKRSNERKRLRRHQRRRRTCSRACKCTCTSSAREYTRPCDRPCTGHCYSR